MFKYVSTGSAEASHLQAGGPAEVGAKKENRQLLRTTGFLGRPMRGAGDGPLFGCDKVALNT